MKSINQFYNKKKGELQSKLWWEKFISKRIWRLIHKRNNKINDWFHKSSKYIIDYCLEQSIWTIVIGDNKEWKQWINLWKQTNQNFTYIPYEKFKWFIEYKAKRVWIKVIRVNESYTSKIDHIVWEKMCHQEEYLWKRVKRWLFRSSLWFEYNSDVNGAIWIIRKYVDKLNKEVSETFYDLLESLGNRGHVDCPLRLNFN